MVTHVKERIDFRDQISRNKLKSFFLMLSIFVVIVFIGYAISLAFDPGYFFVIMSISIVFSLSYTLFSYYNSGKIAIASVRAQVASPTKYKQYHSLIEGLILASGLPKPKLYVMESPQINAFASGRNPENAVICVTTGALEKLDKKELEGVLAHELAHVANFDIRYMTLVAVGVGIISILSEIFLRSLFLGGTDRDDKASAILIIVGIILAIVAPLIVYLVQASFSRKREFVADASAVKFTRYPQGLIGALEKIQKDHVVEHKVSKAVAPLFFSNPFKDLRNLGSTHPPIEKRIEILRRM